MAGRHPIKDAESHVRARGRTAPRQPSRAVLSRRSGLLLPCPRRGSPSGDDRARVSGDEAGLGENEKGHLGGSRVAFARADLEVQLVPGPPGEGWQVSETAILLAAHPRPQLRRGKFFCRDEGMCVGGDHGVLVGLVGSWCSVKRRVGENGLPRAIFWIGILGTRLVRNWYGPGRWMLPSRKDDPMKIPLTLPWWRVKHRSELFEKSPQRQRIL